MHSFLEISLLILIISTKLSGSFTFPGFLGSTQHDSTQISYGENEREVNSLQNLGNEDMPDGNTKCEIETTRNLFRLAQGPHVGISITRTFNSLAAVSAFSIAIWKYVAANKEKVMTSRNSARKRQTFVRIEHIRYTNVNRARMT